MAQTDQTTDQATKPAAADQATQPQPLTLDEFCIRLSQVDRRVELIGGFHSVEILAGHFKDFESTYKSRFTAFVNKPA